MPKLLVINVARKPLSESSVARNSLVWGTGGLNIDGARIRTQNKIEIQSRKESGLTESRTHYSGGNYCEIPENPQTGGQKIGRWPSNLILQHKAECKKVGACQLGSGEYKSGSGTRPGGFGGVGADKGSPTPCGPTYGTETVDTWECAPGCPAADLDSMGEGRSSYPGNKKAAEAHYGKPAETSSSVTSFGYIAESAGMAYSDSGGVSRYFKQVKPE